MIQRFTLSTGVIALAAACATAQAPAEPEVSAPGWLTKDFVEFVDTFEGQWDSDRHVFFAEDAGLDPSKIAPRQHIDIKRVALAADDAVANQAVFQAVRTVEDGEPATLIHTFSIDMEAQSIRQSMSVPGGVLPPEPLDCDVLWNRDGAQFKGNAVGDGCAGLFPRPAEGGPLDVTMTHSEDDFWVTVVRGENKVESRLRRARPFECWTAILRGAEHGDSGEGMQDWDFRQGVKLHDQGGEAELMTDEETPRRVRLRLRNVDWPYGTNRPSLTLYVLEGASDRAVSYAWNEGDAERIGINLRWLQASCTYAREGEDN